MKCLDKKKECEFAGELLIVNPNTREEHLYCMCYAHHSGKKCPYDEESME
jgi:hypothetical protein